MSSSPIMSSCPIALPRISQTIVTMKVSIALGFREQAAGRQLRFATSSASSPSAFLAISARPGFIFSQAPSTIFFKLSKKEKALRSCLSSVVGSREIVVGSSIPAKRAEYNFPTFSFGSSTSMEKPSTPSIAIFPSFSPTLYAF